MSNTDTFSNQRLPAGGSGLPFAQVLEPFGYVGEEVYEAALIVSRGIRRVLDGIRRWHAMRTTVLALSRLDDRSLDDIGVRREDIRRIACGATRGMANRVP